MLDGLAGLGRRRHLERFDGLLRLFETVAIDQAKLVPQRMFEVAVALAGDAMEHLAVGPLELLPVLLLREHLVDALESLEERRI